MPYWYANRTRRHLASFYTFFIEPSPGPYGICGEFCIRFKTRITPSLHKVITQAYQVNKLQPLFSKTRTVLISKSQDLDKRNSVSGYKPMTLQCRLQDINEILKNRTQTVITHIVGKHQTCGILCRTIQTITYIARSVLGVRVGDIRRIAIFRLNYTTLLTEWSMIAFLAFYCLLVLVV